MKPIRASLVVALSLAYFASAFHLPHAGFLSAGLGDWADPYFINYLLEHWHHSLRTWSDPASPPMYLPALGTLGYSHGLILYAPFYVAARLVLNPFQAYNVDSAGGNDVYERWVEAPIEIDASCQSFFIKGASDAYMARSPFMWSLYNVDAMFVSLSRSIPTLNGYSAWTPDGWDLANPQQAGYSPAVDRWIARNQLRGVCEFDIEQRTMTPYR